MYRNLEIFSNFFLGNYLKHQNFQKYKKIAPKKRKKLVTRLGKEPSQIIQFEHMEKVHL
jgi:hypothetical protein